MHVVLVVELVVAALAMLVLPSHCHRRPRWDNT
jgi:hypothetical protein